MARKSKSSPQNKSTNENKQQYHLDSDAPWGGFINMRLDDDQRAEFYSWLEANTAHYPAAFDDMLGAGCKISFAYDYEHQCYICTVMGALVGSAPADRFASTSRAGTLNEVIALTVWKHVELTGGDYGNYRPKDSQFMSWG